MRRRIEATGLVCGALSALFILAACSSSPSGTGTGDQGNSTGGDGFGSGGFATGSGGSPTSSGGFPTSSGGFPTSSGGFPTGSGGDTTSTGGSETGTGGGETGTGGTTGSTGGTTGSTGGTTGGGTGGGGGSTLTPPTAGPCLTDGASQGTIIGDSYVTGFATPALQPELAKLDATIGMFSNYAVAGVSMASGGINAAEDVPIQFNTAIMAHPDIKFSIMDGGGNDILVCDAGANPNCASVCSSPGSSTNAMCTGIVAKAVAAAKTLMQTAATAGVKDTVYFFYPHIPDKNGGYSEILDYSEPLAKASCDGAFAATGGKLNCHFVDLVQPFKAAFGDANPADFSALDGVHPAQAGVTLMAQTIYAKMKADCVGFTAADAMTAGCTCTK